MLNVNSIQRLSDAKPTYYVNVLCDECQTVVQKVASPDETFRILEAEGWAMGYRCHLCPNCFRGFLKTFLKGENNGG